MKKLYSLIFVILVLSLAWSSTARATVAPAPTLTRTATKAFTKTATKPVTKTPSKTATASPTRTRTATATATVTATATATRFVDSPRYIYYSAIWHECYFAVIELMPELESDVNSICRDYLEVALKNEFYKYRLSDGFLKPLPTNWDMTRTPTPNP